MTVDVCTLDVSDGQQEQIETGELIKLIDSQRHSFDESSTQANDNL